MNIIECLEECKIEYTIIIILIDRLEKKRKRFHKKSNENYNYV